MHGRRYSVDPYGPRRLETFWKQAMAPPVSTARMITMRWRD